MAEEAAVLRGYHRLLALTLALCIVLVILAFYLGVEAGLRCRKQKENEWRSQVVDDVLSAPQPRGNEVAVNGELNRPSPEMRY